MTESDGYMPGRNNIQDLELYLSNNLPDIKPNKVKMTPQEDWPPRYESPQDGEPDFQQGLGTPRDQSSAYSEKGLDFKKAVL